MQTHGGLLPDLARTAGVIEETGYGDPARHKHMCHMLAPYRPKHTYWVPILAVHTRTHTRTRNEILHILIAKDFFLKHFLRNEMAFLCYWQLEAIVINEQHSKSVSVCASISVLLLLLSYSIVENGFLRSCLNATTHRSGGQTLKALSEHVNL